MERLFTLPPFDPDSGHLNVLIETPKGSRNKYTWAPEAGGFTLKKILPHGAVFPFDFGFIPSTKGDDGDPLDVLLLMDEPAFCGCLVPARLIGAIQARQKKKNKRQATRNDRLIAIPEADEDQHAIKTLSDLNPRILRQIEHFFISYHAFEGHVFTPFGKLTPQAARKLVHHHTLTPDS